MILYHYYYVIYFYFSTKLIVFIFFTNSQGQDQVYLYSALKGTCADQGDAQPKHQKKKKKNQPTKSIRTYTFYNH